MKSAIESFHAHNTRKALRLTLREVARAHVIANTTVRVAPLTPNQLDRLMHRRLDAEALRVAAMKEVFGKKKKLPLPVFACETDAQDCGEAGHSEGRCGNAACMQHRPRVLGGAS